MNIRSIAATATALTILLSAGFARAAGPYPTKIEENLSRVPATDPPATAAPQLVDAVRGEHPRLLFTADEIAVLKQHIEADPILAQAYKGMPRWAKRAGKLHGTPPNIVTGDGAALTTSVGRLPAVAYVYAIDPSPEVKAVIVKLLEAMLAEPHWARGAELDSNMGAANNMFMVALLFDVVHDDLDEDFRQAVAQKIFTHVRRMWYLGYKQKATIPIKYWQQDPANNHRWHRGAGMIACLLAIADVEGIESDYFLEEMTKEMDFLTKWYPADGDCHEGAGYQRFGFFYLAAAASMMDRNLGTDYLSRPGFRNAWAQQMYYWAPGRKSHMTFGDAPNRETVLNHLAMGFFLSPKLSRDKNVQAAMLNFFHKQITHDNGRQANYPWTLLMCYDPTVGVGDAKAIPTYRLFPDLGAATMRDSWEDDAVLFSFKCGPIGGYKLNEYAHAHSDEEGKPHYVNVAHDDPDANCFSLGFDGELMFHPGNYATHKITRTNNTLTVDGAGQLGEGEAYTQPVEGVDMRDLSYLTGWKVGPAGRIIIEGEAGNAYPALKGFRRTAVWMPGEYILLLDDVRAEGDHRITWRAVSEKAQFANPDTGKCYAYTRSGKRCDFQMLANKDFTGSIDFQVLGGRWTRLLMQQFQFALDTEDVKFACLLDPWKRNVSMTFVDTGDRAEISVSGDGFEDVWTWQPAADMTTPSGITGQRNGQTLLTLTAADTAAKGDE